MQHAENMENQAAEVVNCISTGFFNNEPIQYFRGIGSIDNFVFYDEKQLKTFKLLSDKDRKKTACDIYPFLTRFGCVQYFNNLRRCVMEMW